MTATRNKAEWTLTFGTTKTITLNLEFDTLVNIN